MGLFEKHTDETRLLGHRCLTIMMIHDISGRQVCFSEAEPDVVVCGHKSAAGTFTATGRA